MSFRDIAPGRSNKGYTNLNARNVARPKPNNADQLSTSVEDIRLDLQNLESKISELNRMFQNLGTRVDNQQLRTEIKKAIRDLQFLQQKLNEHLDELDQYAKTKGKNREMLKELSELRRIKEKKALQMKDIIDKAEEYIRTNPPQLSVSSTYLDTEEVENKFDKVNPGNANLQYNDMLIRERHEDILSLSTEMNQVQTVFKDLAEMIADQGEMIEDIESNVTSAAEQSKQGVRQIMKAKASQRSSRRKCWTILVVIIIIVIMVVGLLVWIELSKHKKE
ncbi:syntaxin-7-like protein [Blastocystis sp. ATCC 50177/Nand II]|uniref:Syntaxin-7-like protein n=1 Tax=Blastocystis sp. subtype 1 (strain ATCC 50177 / NandII) TaxID=478820 RepID=A0A196SM93_BLAHN|nr:syntaxin-7-like protein [Blastocystis sp. ATCC 50177/Nand II]